jgi:16S rRNA (guanine966-N2)-methyltransferase
MRIIAGSAGRLPIKAPDKGARPTTDRVREALFSILAQRVVGARVLDLFAGSGALGLEALSRGAHSAVFVDNDRRAAAVIGKNLTTTRLAGGRVVTADAAGFLQRDAGSYDLIFADPPYARTAADVDAVAGLLGGGLLPPRLAPNGWLIAETAAERRAPEAAGWDLLDRRAYGGCAILLYAWVGGG